jgi:signal transduction histidine kinase
VRTAAGQARDLAHGLNPVNVKAGGLPAALEGLAAKVTHSLGAECTFRWDQNAGVRDDTAAAHLYRIAQEAVSNAIRHGKATVIRISFLVVDRTTTSLSISDNGNGINPELAAGLGNSARNPAGFYNGDSGIGLETMQYRARVIGGTLSVERRRVGGTTVACSFSRDADALRRSERKA